MSCGIAGALKRACAFSVSVILCDRIGKLFRITRLRMINNEYLGRIELHLRYIWDTERKALYVFHDLLLFQSAFSDPCVYFPVILADFQGENHRYDVTKFAEWQSQGDVPLKYVPSKNILLTSNMLST
jgi:hypothetical protein